MQQVYFSLSYRDRTINSYFLEKFVQADLRLLADQKSQTWCVAKLERYMLESSGFISIIPRRTSQEKISYSPYIGHELSLARRSGVPRLLFVDKVILNRFRSDFPPDAVPFEYDDPKHDTVLHDTALVTFEGKLREPTFPPLASRTRKKATVIAPTNKALLSAADGVYAILASSGYEPSLVTGRQLLRTFHDVRILETLRDSDICVFILGERLSYANVVLGMAHAHCIPSVRLQFDRRVTDAKPDVMGLIRWSGVEHLITTFNDQFRDFKSGMREPVSMAKDSSTEDAVKELSTGKFDVSRDHLWNPNDAFGLVKHLSLDHSFVRDRVDRVQAGIQQSLGTNPNRKKSMQICRALYDGIRDRDDFVYDIELESMRRDQQPIRMARDLDANNSATCIDLACLFASLLEVAHQRSVIIVLDGPGFAHALAGYWAPDEPFHHQEIDLGTVRGLVRSSDLVLFEATGVAQSERAVAGETNEERQLGHGRLDFSTAKKAAERLLNHEGIALRFLVDVHTLRPSFDS